MKDPAFLFYSNDFLSGIQDLTMEERGQYITLLCLQHQKGHLSDKIIKLAVVNAAADVMAKFRQDSEGLWYNARLELEAEKRALHSQKQRKRALDGWERRKNEAAETPTADAAALPLEDVNVNEDVIINTDIDEAINYLNEKNGSRYRLIESNRKFVRARFNQGFTLEDCKKVVDIKVSKWKGTKWAEFLRPETLFGNKFDSYLNENTEAEIKPFNPMAKYGL